MKKVNTHTLAEEVFDSPKGKYGSGDRHVSIALGRERDSTDLMKRQPFDVEICRVPAGKASCPYHSHSAMWEFYQVISGSGSIRDKTGLTSVVPGDAFIFGPGEEHQVIAGDEDLVLYIVADNPFGEICYYPDSRKWAVRLPTRAIIRSEPLGYYDGEE